MTADLLASPAKATIAVGLFPERLAGKTRGPQNTSEGPEGQVLAINGDDNGLSAVAVDAVVALLPHNAEALCLQDALDVRLGQSFNH